MAEAQHEAGISPTLGISALGLGAAQLAIPDLLANREDLPTARDHTYVSNEDLWRALIGGHERATMVVELRDFWLSEWFPLRPGLFHTGRGSASRAEALRHLLSGPGLDSGGQQAFERWFCGRVAPELIERLRPDSTFVFDPHGKSMMLDGGVGCVRLKAKDLPGGRVWFMGASSSPVGHEGVPVALPDSLHPQVVDELAERGALLCTIKGRLTHTPPDLDPLYRDLVGLPQVYVLVEQLALSAAPPGAKGAASVGGGAVAAGGSAAATGHASAKVGLAERAKSSTWAKIWGALALAAGIVATILVVAGVTDIGAAGYILAVVGVCVAVVPLLGG